MKRAMSTKLMSKVSDRHLKVGHNAKVSISQQFSSCGFFTCLRPDINRIRFSSAILSCYASTGSENPASIPGSLSSFIWLFLLTGGSLLLFYTPLNPCMLAIFDLNYFLSYCIQLIWCGQSPYNIECLCYQQLCSKYKCFEQMREVILLIPYIVLVNTFEFLYPSISADILTINTKATYSFDAFRNLDTNLNPTPYATQPVPASSNIIIIFPSQYDLTLSRPACSSLSINDNPITNFSTSIVGNNVTISNAIVSSLAVANVAIVCSNITNPYPALQTDPFILVIGQDVSSSSTTITLTPAAFQLCNATFAPSFVNTTAALVLYLSPKNKINNNGYIEVQFPSNLQWSQDVSTNHPLPIASSACTIISGQVTAGSCAGLTATAIVRFTITSLTGSSLSQPLSYQINNLFSPPTTSPPDTLSIISYDKDSHKIDTCTTYITGLSPQQLSLAITSSVSPLIVNSATSLTFTFTLTDTLVNTDYIQLTFPSGSTFSFVAISAVNLQLFFSNSRYYSSNSTLLMRQTNGSPTRNNNTVCRITVSSYTAPPSTKTTGSFVLQVYNTQNGLKMQGSGTLSAQANTYSMSVSASTYLINQNAQYSITFTTLDFLTNTSYITLEFPANLTLNISTHCLTSTNFTSPATASCSAVSNLIRIDTLTTNGISANKYTITISSIINPNRAVTSLYFWANFYYLNDSTFLTATASFTGLTYIANTLNLGNTQVTLSDYRVLASGVSANLTFTLLDAAPANSYFTITVPPQITASASSPKCTYFFNNSLRSPACTISGQTYQIPLGNQVVLANTTITIGLNNFGTNPKSTRPTTSFQLYLYSSDNYLINYLNHSIVVSSFIPIGLSFLSISPSNYTNSLYNTYSFYIQQLVAWDSNSYMIIDLPSTIASSSNLTCKNLLSSTSLTCSVANATSINITVSDSLSILSLSIDSLRNSPSYRPSPNFTVTTYTVDGYAYATEWSVSVSTSSPSLFSNISYAYSNPYYNQTTNLTLSIVNNAATTTSYVVTNIAQFNSSINISCLSSNSLPICSLNGPDLIISLNNSTFPTITDVTIINLSVPLANVSQLSIKSYDGPYLMSTYSPIVFQTICTLPCYTCSSSSPTVCLSCYSTTIFTNQIYYYQNNCFAVCPTGTYSTNGSLICQSCSTACAQCSSAATQCTQCVANSSQPVLYLLNSTCLSDCPSGTFANNGTVSAKYTPVCTACLSPCSTCLTATVCLACANSSLYYYNHQCISTCPVNVSIANTTSMQCQPCSTVCLTCINTTTTCLSCNISVAPIYYQQNQTCVNTCPSPLVVDGSVCSSCASPCSTCSIIKTNCTSCINNTFLSMVLNGSCLSKCDQYYFGNTTTLQCQACSSVLGLNCKNCLSSIVCITCDQGFVFYDANKSCLAQTPSGYTNISGIAVACTSNCSQCSTVSYNCTKCSGAYSYYLFAGLGFCQINCPKTALSFNNSCITCTSPCLTCVNALTNCSSCLTGYLLQNNGSYICITSCPDTTFFNSSSSICTNCSSPCLGCLNSALQCTSCLDSAYYTFNSTCVSSCPNNSIIDNVTKSCYSCLSPCLTCSNSANNCTSCITAYYLYSVTNQCLSTCPLSVSVADPNGSFSCVSCANNCYTCSITPTNCASCTQNYSFFNSTCLLSCPAGYYSSSNVCVKCTNSCSTCTSSSTCSSCTPPQLLYSSTCLTSCPVNAAIVVNYTCTPCSSSCLNCSAANYCFSCPAGTALYAGSCVTSCPAPLTIYYNTSSNKLSCFTDSEIASQNLQSTLKISAILPFPFTIITSFLFLCCLMSKIQNIDTYIFGVGYSLYGCAEVGSLIYLLYIYAIGYSFSGDYSLYSLLFFISIAIVALLNFFSLICLTPFLTSDPQFKNWLNYRRRGTPEQESGKQQSEDAQTTQSNKENDSVECCSHTCTFVFFTISSFIVSNKFRLLIFTKLFKFNCLTAHLQNVHGFRAFNVLSFFGLLHEGLVCFVTIKLLMIYGFQDSQLYLATIDCLIVTIISVLLAFLVTQKEDDFFKVHNDFKDGVDLGRRKKDKEREKNMKIDQKRMKGMDSRDKLIDLHDEHSEVQQEVIVNHNIVSSARPQKRSAFWVQVDQNTKTKMRNGSPRNEQTRNIFEMVSDDYDDDKYTPLTKRQQIELFHTSVKPTKKPVKESFMQSRINDWTQADQLLQPESNIKQKGQKLALLNSSIESEVTNQTKQKLNLQRETVHVSLNQMLPPMAIIREMSDPTAKEVDSNEIKSKDQNSNFGEKGSSKNEEYSVAVNKLKGEEIIVIQQQNEELNKTFQKAPSANISFESILPFVHRDGVFIDKKGKVKQQQDRSPPPIKQQQMAVKNQKKQAKPIMASVVPVIGVVGLPKAQSNRLKQDQLKSKQQIKNKEQKQFQQLLDMSEIKQKAPQQKINKKVDKVTQQVQVQELEPVSYKPKIPLPPKQYKQHKAPVLNYKSTLQQQIIPTNNQPAITPQKDIREEMKIQSKNKANSNFGFSSYQLSQKIQPQKQSEKGKPIMHAPRIYKTNNMLQVEEGHNGDEFEQQIERRKEQLLKIKQQVLRNNQMIQRNQNDHKSRRKSKQSIKSLVDQAIQSKRKTQYNQPLIVDHNQLQLQVEESPPLLEVIQISQRKTIKNNESQAVKDNISYNPSEISKNIVEANVLERIQEKSMHSRNIFDQPAYIQSQREDITFPVNGSKEWENPSELKGAKKLQYVSNKNYIQEQNVNKSMGQQKQSYILEQQKVKDIYDQQLQQDNEGQSYEEKEYPSQTQRISQPYLQQKIPVLNIKPDNQLQQQDNNFIEENEQNNSYEDNNGQHMIEAEGQQQISIHNDYQLEERDEEYQYSKEQSQQYEKAREQRQLYRVEYAEDNLQAQEQRDRDFILEDANYNYQEVDKGLTSQSHKTSFELQKTTKKHHQKRQYRPRQESQEGRTAEQIIRKNQKQAEEASTQKQQIIGLLKGVKSRVKKQMPKEERDQRISIKIQHKNIPKLKQAHQNSGLARKSMEKNKPIPQYKIQHKNQQYEEEIYPSQHNPHINLVKPNHLLGRSSSVAQPKTASRLLKKEISQAEMGKGKAKQSKMQQIREFNFGDQISSEQSKYELPQWKQQFAQGEPYLPHYDSRDINPDLPIISKAGRFEDTGLQVIKERKNSRKRSKQSRNKSRKEEKGRNEELHKIYGK